MIFVTGFARGGTTWLRNSIATHPDIGLINRELVLFRDQPPDRGAIERILDAKAAELGLDPGRRFYVEKSPANAPHVDEACRLLPEAKFIFIIRDPRDVFISHKRGTRAWMGGANSTVRGCMRKTRRYYEGYRRARGAGNLLLVRYESLHQDFKAEMRRIFEFIGVEATLEILAECHEKNDFWNVATRHVERRDSPERRGVIGDWVHFLNWRQRWWFRRSSYWTRFMKEYGYSWQPVSYVGILRAMAAAGVHGLSEDDLLEASLRRDRPNVLICHDIDSLPSRRGAASILALAEREAELGFPALYFFLPLDDPRYARVNPAKIAGLIRTLRGQRGLSVGLHLNAAERFFPAEMEDVGDDHPDLVRAVSYLHEQLDRYAQLGIEFRTATAHGYGRRKKRPNNRDSPVFTDELKKRGIQLWDTVLRPRLFAAATGVSHLADVGSAISARDWFTTGPLTSPETYRGFPAGSVIHFLTHPGNYDSRRPIALGRRTNQAPAPELAPVA